MNNFTPNYYSSDLSVSIYEKEQIKAGLEQLANRLKGKYVTGDFTINPNLIDQVVNLIYAAQEYPMISGMLQGLKCILTEAQTSIATASTHEARVNVALAAVASGVAIAAGVAALAKTGLGFVKGVLGGNKG